MGRWMKENIGGKPRIISRKPFVPFYAGGVAVFLSDLDPESMYEFAIGNKSDYLIIDERSIRRFRYENIATFLESNIFEGFNLIKEMETKPGYKIRLFKIIGK